MKTGLLEMNSHFCRCFLGSSCALGSGRLVLAIATTIIKSSLARQQLIVLQMKENAVQKPVQTFKAYATLLQTLIQMGQATSRDKFAA